MSDIAIQVENLGKLYWLRKIGTGTLGSDLSRVWARLRGKEDPFAWIGEANDRTKKPPVILFGCCVFVPCKWA